MESIAIAGAYRKTKPMIHLFMDLPLLKPKPVSVSAKSKQVKNRIRRDTASKKYMDPKIKEIIEMVVEDTVISFDDIVGTSRVSDIVKLRYIAIHLIIENYNAPLVTIAKNINRDHSTVIHARDVVRDQMSYDVKYRKLVNKYEKMFSERFLGDNVKNNLPDNQ